MSDLEVARDDIALSAIAAGNAPDSDDPTLLLLASYRADLDEAAAPPEPLRVDSTVVPLAPRRRRATLVALSAAAGIVVGGLTAGAVAVADRPGESLYAVHVAVFGKAETKTSDVTALLDQASGLLARGDRAGARRLLGRAAAAIPTVPESDRPALRRRLDDLLPYAAEPARPTPRPTPTATRATPRPTESEDRSGSNSGSGRSAEPSESEDHSGSGSSGSGSSGSGSSGSGSSGTSGSSSGSTLDSSGSGSSGSGSSGTSGSGSGLSGSDDSGADDH
ncbi:MAG TPA: hypothetical protein VGX28_05105 [Frankiaceae bacterium]|jgi:hypothetical protein|nr:hypothetical protein [Frankiaceae bacterium]